MWIDIDYYRLFLRIIVTLNISEVHSFCCNYRSHCLDGNVRDTENDTEMEQHCLSPDCSQFSDVSTGNHYALRETN